MTSKVKVNTVETESGSTLTLGKSGDTVTLASGASQSGFGRTGTVDWQTTPKTANFTAANGEGYFINTTSGAITMTMPSGSAGAIVSIQDYNNTFDTNALTISPAEGEEGSVTVIAALVVLTKYPLPDTAVNAAVLAVVSQFTVPVRPNPVCVAPVPS
jgi:hypothetical protein